MIPALSANTQAILLLTAPLIIGRGTDSTDLLSPGEYKRLAQHLRKIELQPADLIQTDGKHVLEACQSEIDVARMQRLLARGFQLSHALERWQSRAIWVISRADAEYPRCLKNRLREDAPAVLYGCGSIDFLNSGGLAVVGSRNTTNDIIDYTRDVGRLAAHAGRTIVSGGARGVDMAAMKGALEAHGNVIGVLAENLEKTAMNRDERNHLRDGRLVLVSSYDPSAGFNVGHALQRNKLIYAFSNASLVIESNFNKGGTWAGAVEQLDKFNFVPVFVRTLGEESVGLKALQSRGAHPWPNPQTIDEFERVLELAASSAKEKRDAEPSLFSEATDEQDAHEAEGVPSGSAVAPVARVSDAIIATRAEDAKSVPDANTFQIPEQGLENDLGHALPAEVLYSTVRQVLTQLLEVPMKEADVAETLNVSNSQAKAWLQRLVEEGILEKHVKPVAYVTKSNKLFE